MKENFNGKVAVVTGAGGTLCSEISLALSLMGVKVFLVGTPRVPGWGLQPHTPGG